MDFKSIAKRNVAGKVYRLKLRDPDQSNDGEEMMYGEKPVIVLHRSASDRESQVALRAIKRARILEAHAETDRLPKEVMDTLSKAEIAAMRTGLDVFDDLCDVAKSVIVGFENIGIPVDTKKPEGEWRDLTNDPDDIQWFLDLTPFDGEIKKGKDKKPILNDDGVPEFEMNNPFAKQIAEAAGRREKASGNGKAA